MSNLVCLGQARGSIVSFTFGTSYGGSVNTYGPDKVTKCHSAGSSYLYPLLRAGVPTPGVQAVHRRRALVSVPSCNEKKGRRWLLGMSSG